MGHNIVLFRLLLVWQALVESQNNNWGAQTD